MENFNNLLSNNPMWTIILIIGMAGVIIMLMVDASKKASKNKDLKLDVIQFAKSLSLLMKVESGYNIQDLYLTRQGYFNGVEYKEENLVNLATAALLINLRKSIDYKKTIRIGDPRLKALEHFDNNSYRSIMEQLNREKLLDYSEEKK